MTCMFQPAMFLKTHVHMKSVSKKNERNPMETENS